MSKILKLYRHLFTRVIVIGSDLEGRDGKYDPFLDDTTETTGQSLLIVDDCILEKQIMRMTSRIFTKGRHKNLSVFFLTQNLYANDPNYRIMSLNATHLILFKMRDIKQIAYLARSFLMESQVQSFINLYKKIVLKKDHGYLLIDYTKNIDSKLQIRTNILQEDYERLSVI